MAMEKTGGRLYNLSSKRLQNEAKPYTHNIRTFIMPDLRYAKQGKYERNGLNRFCLNGKGLLLKVIHRADKGRKAKK